MSSRYTEDDRKKSIFMWLGLFLIMGAMLFAMAYLGGKNVPVPQDGPTDLKDEVTQSDHVIGSREAKAVLVEYGDYQCPACSIYAGMTERLVEEMGDRMLLVYRHFPLRQIHPNADASAVAAEAASLQGKFWEMHNMLYATQRDWDKLSNPTEKFVEYAKEIGLNENEFKANLSSSELKGVVNAHYNRAVEIGLGGTPSFFLNGKRIENPRSYEEFKEIVEKAIVDNK